MSAVVDESTTGALKSQLVRAWRQRWSEAEWSVHLKALLPPPHNTFLAEPYQLTDLLLQQALVGASPNSLILSYFRHATHSQLVRYSSALQSLLKYDEVDRPYCTQSLLQLLAEFTNTLQRGSGGEEGSVLADALLAVVHWLLTLLHKDLQESGSLVVDVCDRLSALWNARYLRYLLCLVAKSNADVIDDIKRLKLSIAELEHTGESKDLVSQAVVIANRLCAVKETQEVLLGQYIVTSTQESVDMDDPQQLIDVSYHPLNISLNVLLTIEAVLHPTNPTSTFVQQVLRIKKAQGLSTSALACELFRTCFMSLVNGADGPDDLKVTALTYLKLPSALGEIIRDEAAGSIEEGIHRLLNYAPLLDLTDLKCKCDCFNYLLKEFIKHNLLTEVQRSSLHLKRHPERQSGHPPKQPAPNAQPSVCFIIMAEHTVTSILKALDADYTKNQESLHGILHKMMTGRSFKLIVAAAAATKRLPSFATKLVKFNEFAKASSGETPESSVIRAQLFDITFLMLCNMNQLYKGSKAEGMLSVGGESSQSFYSQWAQRCLPENGHYKSLDLQPTPDQQKVELLLTQLSPGSEIKTSLTKWHEVCRHVQYALQEVLYAWEHGVLTQEGVKLMLEKMRSQMCCLPVICVAWLCSYINTCEQDARHKPLAMISMFQAPHTPDPHNSYYTERCHLMQAIITEIVADLITSTTMSPPQQLPATTPAQHLLLTTYHKVFSQGSITITQVHTLHQILQVSGPRWFTYNLVKELLHVERGEELSQGVALVYGLFHMDVAGCTSCLLQHTLPSLIHSHDTQPLSQPCGSALASLTAMCLALITPHALPDGEKVQKRGKKRNRSYLDLQDDEDGQPSKLRRLSEQQLPLSCSLPQADVGSGCEDTEAESGDPLISLLGGLFELFMEVLSRPEVSPSAAFVLEVLKQLVKTGPPTMNYVLQAMPPNLLPELLRCFPREVDMDMLLRLSDLSDVSGRQKAAKYLHLALRHNST